MPLTRRTFLGTTATATLGACTSTTTDSQPPVARTHPSRDRFDPWIEVDVANLHFNVAQLRRLGGGHDNIIAVIKNNAYGLGMVETARRLEPLPAIVGFAVVKADAAIALREAGIRKPILHMGISTPEQALELVTRDVQLSLYTDDAELRINDIAAKTKSRVAAHLYFDTGLGRLGMPYHRAQPWIASLAANPALNIVGSYMCFSEDLAFDVEQLTRFQTLAAVAKTNGISIGQLHAASSTAMFHQPAACLDMVRPGMALYGGYPHTPELEQQRAELRSALRFRCRVVRVEQIRAGETVGYGRKYVANAPTWIATLPAGHVDGVPRVAVTGARVLIGNRTYPYIGAVSASHCIVELGAEQSAHVGDVATLIGPDHAHVVPNAVEKACGASVYDLLMHLSPSLPRFYV